MAGLRSLNTHLKLHLRRPSLSLTHRRHRSDKPHHPQIIEIDLDSSPETSNATRIRKLDDVIHSIIVKRSAPDWLPFLPGYSYWVPPSKGMGGGAGGLFDVIGKLAGKERGREEVMPFSSVRGWPSSSFFIEGSDHMRPMSVDVDVHVVEVKFQEDSDTESKSEDEEH